MIAKITDPSVITQAAAAVGVRVQDLRPVNTKGTRVRFTLRPITGGKFYRRGFSGRKIAAVCWHGHRDFFRALFERDPEAAVQTRATRETCGWYTAANFEAEFGKTDTNIGSQMRPLKYSAACDCAGDALKGRLSMQTIHKAVERALNAGAIEFSAPDYAEPGYTKDGDRAILFANWNAKTEYNRETRQFDTKDDSMPRLAELAEKAGYTTEWSDEWATCDTCGNAVRITGDSYGWTRAYVEDDNTSERTCKSCLEADSDAFAEYVRSLEGKHKSALTFGDDKLEDLGYRKVNEESYEHGWYPGQSDSPEVIAKSLRGKGVTRFLFAIDSVGQFDLRFSLWVHESEVAQATAVESALPYEPAEELGKALRGEPSVAYTVTTRTLTPEEFVSGDWAKDKR